MTREEYVNKITTSLVNKFHPLKIVLFGSHATGEQTKDSDLDLFVVMNTTERPVQRRITLSKMFLQREYPLDFIVYTPEELQQKTKDQDPFLKNILEKGKILYEE